MERLRTAVGNGSAAPGDLLDMARAELAVGRAHRARTILAEFRSATPINPALLPLLGAVEYASGNFAAAGSMFVEAGRFASGTRKGILAARAGVAFELAGLTDSAAAQYRLAGSELRAIAGWLAVRQARVTPLSVPALELLRQAPPEAARLVSLARAEILLAAGDTGRAVRALIRGGAPAWAARLALAMGDSSEARRAAYDALRSADTAAFRVGLVLATTALVPRSREELVAAARAHRRAGEHQQSVDRLRQAVEMGGASAEVFLLLGDLEAQAGSHMGAIAAYEEAALLGGTYGALAEYKRAQSLLRLRRSAEGYSSLAEFARRHPQHRLAPVALYLVAERCRSTRRLGEADSLYREVTQRWPGDRYAGRARLRLASLALARRDTSAAIRWYRSELLVGGAERHAAGLLLAQLLQAAGDTAGAGEAWATLAVEDSLGYYGTMARLAAGMPLPAFHPSPNRVLAPSVRLTLQRLDLLRASYLWEEADEVVQHHMQSWQAPAGEILDVAEGLIGRGWVAEGVRLGWQAAETGVLNDTRVLRVIFPWPFRRLIEAEAEAHGVDPYLVAAMIRQESTFRAEVTSRAGARGLMQLMPRTAAGLARRLGVEWDDQLLAVADANLHLGTAHLAALLRSYRGNVIAALAAYNAGSRPVARWLRYPEAKDQFRFVERIPYAETRRYVRAVLRNRALYRALYPPAESQAVDDQ